MPALTPRPPDPDLVAPRGTDQYRDAVHKLHQWVAYNVLRGVPLEELVDRWGEVGSTREGRAHHDWDEWTQNPPSEYGEEQWNIGNFQRMIREEGFTEWPPGSGSFFNDPANDQSARQWFNQYGDRIPPPRDGGPDIDYDAVNSAYGGSIKRYLQEEGALREKEKKAPGLMPTGPTGPGVTNPNINPAPPNMPTGGMADRQDNKPQPGLTAPGSVPNYYPGGQTENKGPRMRPHPAITGQMDNNMPSRYSAALSGGMQMPNRFGTQQPQQQQQKPQRKRIGAGWYSTWS